MSTESLESWGVEVRDPEKWAEIMEALRQPSPNDIEPAGINHAEQKENAKRFWEMLTKSK